MVTPRKLCVDPKQSRTSRGPLRVLTLCVCAAQVRHAVLSKGTASLIQYLSGRVDGHERKQAAALAAARRGCPPPYFDVDHSLFPLRRTARAAAVASSDGGASARSGARVGAGAGAGASAPRGRVGADTAAARRPSATQSRRHEPPRPAPVYQPMRLPAPAGAGDGFAARHATPQASRGAAVDTHTMRAAPSGEADALRQQLAQLREEAAKLEDQMQAGGLSKPKQYAVRAGVGSEGGKYSHALFGTCGSRSFLLLLLLFCCCCSTGEETAGTSAISANSR